MQNIIQGKVVVIKNDDDYYNIKEESILIAENTTPEVMVAIKKLKAIVTEIDNKLCHAAIIAREFQKPLLMGIDNTTNKFKTGERIVIDFQKKAIKKII
ncbi:MAG: PEP-utilizing enzyme [Candidatus Pacebacteria bacterium]|nr:PEP-utilizing enzyme [Candidatus Paceibacterota bacterium]